MLWYSESRFFRLIYRYGDHCISPFLPEGFSLHNADPETLADHINRCYDDIKVTVEQLEEYKKQPVFNSDLWITVIDDATGTVAASGLAEIDSNCREGILEWIQVTPEYRRRHLGEFIVYELLNRMKNKVDFVTVSGDCDNKANPESLYRKCGFTGNDIWHILKEK